ncbi:Calx-beta domain-containing protein [Chitinophaga nivalis]|uniref:Gliding motility-associated C-terminal domain-containing protein n=1 Tax=Chitinophaga nivalis TaxID=2991709 RepID=A0ABT3IRE3_9BACT|nr:Calx-beta domain-containing protein [Chitinophaga nivalis]MCW3463759.1 gliding motility-associated C-terminal domain-containing protein [Chitinophaga nivalis]MCW3486551.1 gliding motility-associated C-terminal domain-containing protein [Chitinophaga nivalis]
MLLLSYPKKERRDVMLFWLRLTLLLPGLLLIVFSGLQAQTVRVINPNGGNTASDGLRIEIDADGPNAGNYRIYRNGKCETYRGSIDPGIVPSLILVKQIPRVVSSEVRPSVCEVSDVLGAGTTANPYRINIIGTIDPEPAATFQKGALITTISYVKGDPYFILDFTLNSNQSGYTPYLYLSEYTVMQQELHPADPDNPGAESWCAHGFINGATSPSLVGQFRTATSCAAYNTPLTHVYAAQSGFSSYYAGDEYLRNEKQNEIDLYNTNRQNVVTNYNRGLAVALNMGYKSPANAAIGGAVMVGYGSQTDFSDYEQLRTNVLVPRATSSGSTPITVEFASATAVDDEGSTNHAPASLKLRVVTGGVLKTPAYLKMVVGNAGTAVAGTDYSMQEGYMIPAKTYTAGEIISLDNVTIHGNNRLEYSRNLTFELVPTCSPMVLVGAQKTCAYTIKDDEPRDLTLKVPMAIAEGTTGVGKVSLPTGVLTSQKIWVKLRPDATSTALLNDDYLIPDSVLIDIGKSDADIMIKVLNDKILEKEESLKLVAAADVMGQFQTTTGDATKLLDDTRNQSEYTVISVLKSATLPEGYKGKLKVSLPDGVTTDIPVTVNLTTSGTATSGLDYEITPASVILTGHEIEVDLDIKPDTRIEGNETLKIVPASSDPTDIGFKEMAADIIIKDAQLPATITLHLSKISIEEGQSADLWAELPAGLTTDIPIDVKIDTGTTSTALTGSYSGLPALIKILPPGNVPVKYPITATVNKVWDDDRYLIINGSTTDNGIVIGDSVKLSITDKTAGQPKLLTLKADKANLKEDDSTKFTIALPTGYSSAKDIVISLSKNPTGTEASDGDFEYVQSQIKLPAFTNNVLTDFTVIRAKKDGIIEKKEALYIAGNATGYTVADAKVEIEDQTRLNPANTVVTFAAAAQHLNEKGAPENTTITFNLPANITTEIPIKVKLPQITGTATRTDDYQLLPEVNFTGTGGSALLTVVADKLIEGLEDFKITAAVSDEETTPYTMVGNSLDFDIKDDQLPATVTLHLSKNTIEEGTTADLWAELPVGVTTAIPIVVNITPGTTSTAINTSYSGLPAQIKILPPGNVPVKYPITAIANKVWDDDRYLIINGSTTDNGIVMGDSVKLSMVDKTTGQPKLITLQADKANLKEDDSTKFTITLPAGYTAAKDIVISLRKNPTGTEASDGDFEYVQQQIKLPAYTNSTLTAFTVIRAKKDGIIEKKEALYIAGDATGYTVSDAKVEIEDQTRLNPANTVVTFAAAAQHLNEKGAPESTVITFKLPTNVTTEIPIKVKLPQITGTATRTDDYQLLPEVNFTGAGGSAQLTVVADKLIEGLEDFKITAAVSDEEATSYTMVGNSLDFDIKDDQLPATVTLHLSKNIIEEGTTADLWAELPAGVTTAIPIVVNITPGTTSTALGTSYSGLPAQIKILPSGNVPVKYPVKAIENKVWDDDRYLIINGSTTDNGIVIGDSVKLSMVDKTTGQPKQITLQADKANVKEDDSTKFTITLPAGYTAAKDIVISLRKNPTGTTASDGDFEYVQQQIKLPAYTNSTLTAFTVIRAKKDGIIEKAEDLYIAGDATGYTVSDAKVVIVDQTRLNPANTVVTFAAAAQHLNEKGAPENTTITFNLPANVTTEIPIKVKLPQTTGTATAGTDYQLQPEVSFTGAGGSTLLAVTADLLIEGLEDFRIAASVSDEETTAYTMVGNNLDFDIKDAQLPATITLHLSQNTIEEGSTADLWAELPAGVTTAIPIVVNIAAGTTSTALSNSYSGLPAQIKILPPGNVPVKYPVKAIENKVWDDDRYLIINGSTTDNGIVIGDSVKLSMVDKTTGQQKLIILQADKATVKEDDSTKFTITLPAGYTAAKDIVISLRKNLTGTTASDGDFEYVQQQIKLPAYTNSTLTAFTVIRAKKDGIIERAEDLYIAGDAAGYTISDAKVVIVDQTRLNPANTVVTFAAAAQHLNEKGAPENTVITFKLPANVTTEIPIKVKLPQSTGTATSGTDYQLQPEVSFTGAGGNTLLTVTPDLLIEGLEDFRIAATVSDEETTAYTMAGNLLDFDIKDAQLPATITLHLSQNTIEEGSTADLWAELPAGVTTAIPILVNITAGTTSTALSNSYSGLPTQIKILPPGNVPVKYPIKAIENKVWDDDRYLIINGSTTDNGIVIGDSVKLSMVDKTTGQQKLIILQADKATVKEDDSTKFTITLPAGYTAAKDIVISLRKNPTGTTASDGDFEYVQQQIKLPAYTNSTLTAFTVIRAKKDGIIERAEDLYIAGDATGYTISDAKVVIEDQTRLNPANTVVTFAAADQHLNEKGAPESTSITFKLPANVTTEIPIKVKLPQTTGTATYGTDYQLLPEVNFTGTGGNTLLAVTQDILVEGPETFHLAPVVSDEMGTVYTLGGNPLDFDIKDEQFPLTAPIILSGAPDTIQEGAIAGTKITATLPNGWIAGKDLTVQLSKDAAASTAADSRHSSIPAVITIKNGTKAGVSTPITATLNDVMDDAASIRLEGNKGIAELPVTGTTVYIKDSTANLPGARTLTLTPDRTLVPEGQPVMVTVKMPYASTKDVLVNLQVDNSTEASAGSDYSFTTPVFRLDAGKKTAVFELIKTATDNILEKNEAVKVNANASGYTINNLNLVVQDQTRLLPANLVLTTTVFKSPLTEGDNGPVTISLPAGITTEVPITIQLPHTGGKAEAGIDYLLSNTAVLASGNSTQTGLTINKDNFTEGPEDFTITAKATDGISNYTMQPLHLVIEDDPTQYPLPALIELSSNTDKIDEGGAGVILKAQLPNGLQAGHDIVIHISNDPARSTADVQDHNTLPVPFDIIIKKGAREGVAAFEFKAKKDLVLEEDETYTFIGTTDDPVNRKVGDKNITILDRTHDDPATGFIHISSLSPDTHVLEGNVYHAKVSLAPGVTSSRDIRIGLAIGGSSVAGADDIMNMPATVTIQANVPYVSFSFVAKKDFVLEKAELLRIVAMPLNYPGMKGDSLAVIIDDVTSLNPDNLKMEMRIDSSVVHEGSKTAVTFGFVNDQITSAENIKIAIATQAGITNTDAADYSGLPDEVTLAAGNHDKTVQLHITADNVLEGDEQVQFTAKLLTAGYTIKQPGLLLIPETGDMLVTLSKTKDAAEPATHGAYLIKLPGTSTAAADVKVVFYVSSIIGTTNIAPIQTAVNIPAGKNSVAVPVNVIDNNVIEGDEEVRVALMLAQMKRFNKNMALDVNDQDTVTLIVHDDESDATGPKAVSREMLIEKVADAAEPAVPGSFRIRFTDAALSAVKDVVVNYTIAGDAVADSRYKKLSGQATIPAGQHSATVVVTPIDNNIVEGDESVDLTLQKVSSTLAGVTWPLSKQTTAEVIIHDNDTLVLDLTTNVTTAAEGEAVSFTMKSVNKAAHDMPIRLKVTQDAARKFTASEGTVNGDMITVTLPALQTEHTFTITATDNDVNDDDGYLKVAIQPYTGNNGGPLYKPGTAAEKEVVITDNDPLTLQFAADKFSVKEGNMGDRNPLNFNLKMNRKSSRPITISFDFEASTDGVEYPFMGYKATPGVDFDNTVKQVVIPAYETMAKVPVTIIGDTIFEQNETFVLKMNAVSVPSGKYVPVIGDLTKATGVILNDDPMCRPCDADGDGLSNEEEDINGNGDPFDDDTDGDGIPNFLDLDSDGDGVPDSVERFTTDKRYIDNNKNKIRVHPAISPNGDGQGNDVMYIENIEKYPKNEVVIFNRWGGTIFRLNNYDNKVNNFKGRANAGGNVGADVPDGSYFYNIEIWADGKQERYTGFIVIKR